MADDIAPAEEIATPKSVTAAAVRAAAATAPPPARSGGTTAVVEERQNPFAPAAIDPWAATAPPPPAPLPRVPAQAAVDTFAAVSEQTPTGSRRPTPYLDTNPFSGGDHAPAPRKLPWMQIGIGVAAVAAGVALAVFKVFG